MCCCARYKLAHGFNKEKEVLVNYSLRVSSAYDRVMSCLQLPKLTSWLLPLVVFNSAITELLRAIRENKKKIASGMFHLTLD